jgi:cytochrome P450
MQEIRTVFASREEIRFGPKLNSCRYLHACVSECLRLTPPVAAAPFREVMKGGAMVDGHFIPQGTNIGTGIYSIQHNDQYFKNPYEFAPERWLRDGPLSAPLDTEAYLPFMVGPRACLGKALASSQSMLAMAHVCYSMDFTVAESMRDFGAGSADAPLGRHRPDEYQLHDHITVARNGPSVQFRRRC